MPGGCASPLGEARTLRGRLLDPRGVSRVAGARVQVRAGPFPWEAETAWDGAFEIHGLPPGPWTLEAGAWLDGVRYEVRREVAEGPPVDVVLVPESD